MLPDVCSESWLTSQTKDGQLSEFISGHLSLSPCLVGCLTELLTSTLLLFIKLNAHTGLGPGQLVGRQVLGSPVLGDIQLSLCDKRGNLEVEVRPIRESQKLENSVKVIRARGLQSKPGSKLLPGYFFQSHLCFPFLTLFHPSSLGESVPRVRQEVPGQGEDFGRSENSRPVVPAAAHLPPALRRLRPPGAAKFSPSCPSLHDFVFASR